MTTSGRALYPPVPLANTIGVRSGRQAAKATIISIMAMTSTHPTGSSLPGGDSLGADRNGAPAPAQPSQRSSIAAGAFGNMFEWYDFGVYGFFGATIGRSFFPSESPTTSLLAAFGVFAAAFFMRPLGGMVFGHIGDRYGRKNALVISTGLMTASTFAMGCLPTYDTAGILAPVLLVLLRLGQGLSVGGEYTASAIYLVENADPRRRGLIGGLAGMGAAGGTLIGSILGAIITSVLTPDQVQEWGWRIPFLMGIGLGVFILVLRRRMVERQMEEALVEDPSLSETRSPLRAALESDGPAVARALVMNLALAASVYVVFVYLVTYMHTEAHVSHSTAFILSSCASAANIIAIPFIGRLSDIVGRKTILMIGAIGLAVLSWPLFFLIASGQPALMLVGQLSFALLIATYGTALPTALVELFKHRSRCTALAISYNAAMALVGGTAPMAATWIVHHLQITTGPGLYISVLSLLSLGAVLTMRDRTGEPLR